MARSPRSFHVSSDLDNALPDEDGDAAALARFTRAFSAGNVAPLLVEGGDPDDVAAATTEAVEAGPRATDDLRGSRIGPPQRGASLDPSLAWAFA